MTTRDQTDEWAQLIGLQALAFLAAEESLLSRFLALSGVEPIHLRSRADDPELLAGVLDFLLAHEPDLHSFCIACGLEPDAPATARRALGHAC